MSEDTRVAKYNVYRVYYYKNIEQTLPWGLGRDLPTPQQVKTQTHVYLAHCDGVSFDDVYTQMQGESWSPNGEARELISRLGLKHTSMSMGDVIETEDGKMFLCAMNGWIELGTRLTDFMRRSLWLCECKGERVAHESFYIEGDDRKHYRCLHCGKEWAQGEYAFSHTRR